MDLGAYAQIDELKDIAEAADIDIPSLRGYRLMGEQAPVSDEELEEIINEAVGTYWWLLSADSDPEWYDHTREDFVLGYRPRHIPPASKDTVCGPDSKETIYKTSVFQEIGELKARIKREYMLWNRYAGLKDVMYIHSRMGGDARVHQHFEGEYARWNGFDARKQPWYLDSCADSVDPTYCNIYARISTGGSE